jgi:hypothetical protein
MTVYILYNFERLSRSLPVTGLHLLPAIIFIKHHSALSVDFILPSVSSMSGVSRWGAGDDCRMMSLYKLRTFQRMLLGGLTKQHNRRSM